MNLVIAKHCVFKLWQNVIPKNPELSERYTVPFKIHVSNSQNVDEVIGEIKFVLNKLSPDEIHKASEEGCFEGSFRLIIMAGKILSDKKIELKDPLKKRYQQALRKYIL